jgi:hypothetical protein
MRGLVMKHPITTSVTPNIKLDEEYRAAIY